MKCTSGCERSSSRATAMMNSCPFWPLSSAPTWPTTSLPGSSRADHARSRRVDRQPAAAAVHDAHWDRGIVGADDLRDLRRDGRDACRAAIRLVREPMLANRIVDAARDRRTACPTTATARMPRRRCGLRGRGSTTHRAWRASPTRRRRRPRELRCRGRAGAPPSGAAAPRDERLAARCGSRDRGSRARFAAHRLDSREQC